MGVTKHRNPHWNTCLGFNWLSGKHWIHPMGWTDEGAKRQCGVRGAVFHHAGVQQLCQLRLCIPVWECLVHNWIWSSSRVCIGTRLVRHGRELVAGKNFAQAWMECHLVHYTFFRSGLCRCMVLLTMHMHDLVAHEKCYLLCMYTVQQIWRNVIRACTWAVGSSA